MTNFFFNKCGDEQEFSQSTNFNKLNIDKYKLDLSEFRINQMKTKEVDLFYNLNMIYIIHSSKKIKQNQFILNFA